MKVRNNSGPKTVPCGIPLMTAAFSEGASSMATCCVQFVRNDEIKWCIQPLIP